MRLYHEILFIISVILADILFRTGSLNYGKNNFKNKTTFTTTGPAWR